MDNSNVMDKRKFLSYASRLALPLMIQNLISTLVSSADTVMLSYVSQTAMAASSLANQFTFVLFCFYFGLAAGTSVLCAQYWGKGDKKTVERIIGLATKLTLLISIIFFLISFFLPEYVMKFFSESPDTIAIGAKYLKIIAFSYVFMGFSQVYVSALRSAGKVVFPSLTYVISLLVNVTLNATFIFGLCGMPKLGMVGVALGTVTARVVEAIMCLVYSFYSKEIKFRLKYVFERAGILMTDFLKICLPSVANDAVWGLAASAFAAILGHIGDDIVAANTVAMIVVNVGAIACRGFANATTIIISQELGKNNMEGTKIYASRMLKLTIAVSVVGCGIMMIIRPFMLMFYEDKLTPTALHYLSMIMIMTTWRLIGEGINTCLICGCFRGGGDSKYGMILDTVYMWCVAVPAMALAAYVFKLPPLWVYFVMSLDEFGKMPVVFGHFLKYKWMKNITRDEAELASK
ncbi:MAG: MATE family efflux transporter [Clostridia bacterium]|nr:MATE family efflux transporter [Clostridia bacterium]